MDNKTKDNLKDKLAPGVARSTVDDTVNEIYRIHLSEEVLELSNEFCKYYYATDAQTEEEFFAIVFENNFLHPIDNIDFFYKNNIVHLNTIHNYSIVRLSSTKEEHLAVIVDKYDPSDNLASYLASGNSVIAADLEDIIDKFSNVFSILYDEGIYGYSINPSNILMHEGKFLALKEFINSYPNFYQENQYLAPELVECHPAARYISSIKSDVYALGVTMFEAYTSKSIWKEHNSIIEYNNARFENTTSKYLLSRTRVPEKLRVFFKWVLHDEANVRWEASHIKDWLSGKITKAAYESLSDNKNTIAFGEVSYSSLKSIAYAIFNNWNEAIKFTKDNKLFKWASREQLDNDSLEQIKALVDKKSESPFMVTNSINSHIKISKLLSLLDPNGSIRCQGIAFSASSIPYFIYYLVVQNKREITEKVLKLIKEDAWLLYEKNHDAAGHLKKIPADDYKNLASYVNTGSIVKSIERFAYSLNKNACCQSPLLKDKYVTTIYELLGALDTYAEKNPKKFNIDRNIVAFVSAKLDIVDDIKPAILANFPKFVEHPVVRALTIFNILEQHEPEIETPNIRSAIISDLKDLFEEHIHNVEFKKRLISQLTEVAKNGSLSKVIQLLSNQQQFVNDYNGYYEACRKAKLIEEQIKILRNEDKMFSGALLLGQKITVLVSYVLCFIVTITVII
jgi:hypothetical protein